MGIKYTDEILALQDEINTDADNLLTFLVEKLLEQLKEEDRQVFREARAKIEAKNQLLEKLKGDK